MTADNWLFLGVAAAVLFGFAVYVDREAEKEFNERKEGWKP